MMQTVTQQWHRPVLPRIVGVALLVLSVGGCSSKQGGNGSLTHQTKPTPTPEKSHEVAPPEAEPPPTKLVVSSYCGYPQPKAAWGVDGRCLKGPFRGDLFTENRGAEVPFEEAAKACLANPQCKGITAQFNAGVPFSTVTTLSEPFRPNDHTYGCSYLVLPCEK